MKSISKLLLGLTIVGIALSSCNKDDEEEVIVEPSKTSLLSAHTWIVTDIKLNPLGLSIWQDVPDCEKDNTYKFNADNTGLLGYTPLKCDPQEPDSQQMIWLWEDQETTIRIPSDSLDLVITNVQITSNSMTGNTTYIEQGTQVNVKLILAPN